MSSFSEKTYQDNFQETIATLNEEQLRAVVNIEGPMMVLAGPGTGKTHILATRIGQILQQTDTQAHNILCLTFTDAGVQAMRQRLLSIIGTDAHRVHVYTFHSFCNKVLQENPELFGKYDMELISDLEKLEILKTIIDQLDPNHPFIKGRSDYYFYQSHVLDLFGKMKNEGWTVENVNTQIDAYLKDIPTREGFIYQRNSKAGKKGDIRQSKVAEETLKKELIRAAADLFPTYVQMMKERNRYDYDDMILWVLEAFKNNEHLLRRYQEQYLYFLVDEYQDTNGSQNQILKSLIDYWDNPNVFIVGDDDQSIFEFQGARLKNLTDFIQDYRDVELVVLKKNYRSTQEIIDFASHLILNNEKRVINEIPGLEKILEAGNAEMLSLDVKPYFTQFPNRMHENAEIVFQLEVLQEKDFPLNEVAIIYAKHKQVDTIRTLLEKKGIPFQTKKEIDILRTPLIGNLKLLLEYISLETLSPYSGEHLVYKLLHFDFFNLDKRDIPKIGFFMRENDYKWKDLIDDDGLLSELTLHQSVAFQVFRKFMREVIADTHNVSLIALLEKIINRSGILTQVLKTEKDKSWFVQMLNTFLEFAKQETFKNKSLDLKGFIHLVNRMLEAKLPLRMQKVVHNDEGVHLMTAHASKGMEFRHVYMIDCVKDSWQSARGGKYNFTLPDTLTFSGEEDSLEATRRLFYVAMTRAKESLRISWAEKRNDNKTLERTQFIDELEAKVDIELHKKTIAEVELINTQSNLLMETNLPHIPEQERDRIDSILQDFKMTTSALNQYLRCPLTFYYNQILKIPTAKSESAVYGTAMHQALYRLFSKMVKDEDKGFPSVKAFIGFFEEEMQRVQNKFAPEKYQQFLEKGKANLTSFFNENISKWERNVRLEHNVYNVELDGVPMEGVIDKIEFGQKSKVHIIDYKTGAKKSDTVRKITEKNKNGGAYLRQLYFYKFLYEAQTLHQQKVQSASVQYIEQNKKGEHDIFTTYFDAEGLVLMKNLIKETYQKIQNHEFYQGCDERNCKWCNFTRNNQVPDSFVDEEVEMLDDLA